VTAEPQETILILGKKGWHKSKMQLLPVVLLHYSFIWSIVMYKKLMFLAMILALCLMTTVNAATIIWVSDAYDDNADGEPDDQPWMDVLEANGYTVDTSFRSQEGRTLDDAKIEALNAADLIIVSRNSNSGDYASDATEVTRWNSITTPIMLQAMHIVRNSRWLWADTTTLPNVAGASINIIEAGHPIFAGVADGAQLLNPDMGPTTFVGITDMGNGTVLAQVEGQDATWVAEWEPGVEFYPGAGQFAGGPRMVFCAGTQEAAPEVGRGEYNLTPDGEIMFLNAVHYLLGGARETASGPDPKDGAIIEDTWVTLSWSPGDFAASHDVYLGDNLDDVSNATVDSDLFRGNQTTTFFTAGFPGFAYPEGLVPGTTYYWRIDEVNAPPDETVFKGDVWSFSVPPKTAYNPSPADNAEAIGPDNVTLSWTAGHGAKLHTVYVGTDYDQISNATGGMMVGSTTYNAGSLDAEKVYYWRVDEFDGVGTYKGEVWTFTTPGAVSAPQPTNGATGVSMTTSLSWTAATNATSHQVYLGLDKDVVRNADAGAPEYQGSAALGSESIDPGKLAWDTLYYWRVDAVTSAGPVKGPIWSFTTADFVIVEDFESYTDDDIAGEAIWQSWIDGFGVADNGAQVGYLLPPYAEQTIVHGGAQSMPLLYTNEAGVTNSEAALTLAQTRDWTEEGVGELSIWYRGNAANAADPLYMAISNAAGAPAIVANEDTAAAQARTWKQWVIPLQAFVDQGINLVNVDKIAIGLGSKSGMAATGGTGTIFFDDIALYRSQP